MILSTYSKIYQLGHRATRSLFEGPVVVQEKVDGSQFSFANLDGQLYARSKNNPVGCGGNQEGMFAKAYATAEAVMASGTLLDGMVVRAEVVDKPRHNVLTYARVPVGNLIIYDIEMGDRSGNYFRPPQLKDQVDKWGLEVVPTIAWADFTMETFKESIPAWFERESILGGTKIEGVVVKNYLQKDADDDILMGKFVSEGFKERMDPTHIAKPQGTMVQQILSEFNKEAIWVKAVQHLRDAGRLQGDPKDIGALIAEIRLDFKTENGAEIVERIVKAYYGDVEAGIIYGFPQWYKNKLTEGQ